MVRLWKETHPFGIDPFFQGLEEKVPNLGKIQQALTQLVLQGLVFLRHAAFDQTVNRRNDEERQQG